MQWLMLQQKTPKDYVIATGKQYSIRDFITWACNDLGIDIEFSGQGLDEIGIIKSIKEDNNFLSVGDTIVKISKKYFRPTEVDSLLGDASKAKKDLGWEPKLTAREMCSEMIEADLKESKFHADK